MANENTANQLDQKIADSRKQLENLTLDINTLQQQKKDLQTEVNDLENTIKEAVQSAFKKKQDDIDLQKADVISSQKLVDEASAKNKADQEALTQGRIDLDKSKKNLEGSIAKHENNIQKHKVAITKFNALKQTIKENLDAIDV